MSDKIELAVKAVKDNTYSFCKLITPNDAGQTGAHQAGIYIPKNSIKLLFDEPGLKGTLKDKPAKMHWHDGSITQCRIIYYGQGTRNEYRITRLGKHFKVGELLLIVKSRQNDEDYFGFVLGEEDEIIEFLNAFNLKRNSLNKLIPVESQTDTIKEWPYISNLLTDLNKSDNQENLGESIGFRPKANILVLLGEELIRSPVMAIYELIKNGYDADAETVDVDFENIENIKGAKIKVKDNGTGITEEVLKNVWFEPGTDFRKPVNSEGKRTIKRTPIHNRIPMGEKGVGRFAVHKLGDKIKLISRPAKVILNADGYFEKVELLNYELKVEIDWRSFSQEKYLDSVNIKWKKNDNPELFELNTHGTYIEISSLKEEWTRGMARQLKRHTVSMVSPKKTFQKNTISEKESNKFNINLTFSNLWIENIPETNDILKQAPYRLEAKIDADYNLTFEYRFSLANNQELGSRVIDVEYKNESGINKYFRNIKQELRPFFRSFLNEKEYDKNSIDDLIDRHLTPTIPYGGLMFELYSYDLDSNSLNDITNDAKSVKVLLKEQAGVKVFKGDLRVYDYGDPGNDWLGLDLKRVQNKEWFSNNQNIGFVYLDATVSAALIEKTNREGFIQNTAYDHFTIILDFILSEFKAERQSDRSRWLRYNKKEVGISFEAQVSDLRQLINQTNLISESKIKLIEEAEKLGKRYEQDRNTLLIPAGVGMTASFAMHEIEKLVPRMQESVKENPANINRIKDQVDELKDYVDGILSILRKGGNKPISLIESINQAVSNYASRIKYRKIDVQINHNIDIGLITCDKRLLITMLMNLLDNSIYWLDAINKPNKGIYISTYKEGNTISILVVDNGPGFRDKVEDIVMPFFTRKEGGIGIGMYLVDTIMIKYGKLKIIFDKDYLKEKSVPDMYTGAAVELVFNKYIEAK